MSVQDLMGEFMEFITTPRRFVRVAFIGGIAVALVAMFFICGTHAATVGPVVHLLTAEEASRPASKSFGFAAQSADNGPSIEAPELEVEEFRPFVLAVKFSPRNGVAPDPATLKVECLKTPAIDLTLRVRPYATADGIRIDQVILPEGLHRFRVSVSDVHGRLSEKEFVVLVSGAF
jgi:hypothetical protein